MFTLKALTPSIEIDEPPTNIEDPLTEILLLVKLELLTVKSLIEYMKNEPITTILLPFRKTPLLSKFELLTNKVASGGELKSPYINTALPPISG